MRSRALVLLALLAPSPAAAAPPAPDRVRFCGLVRACGLPQPLGWCDGVAASPSFDAPRCAEARRLVASGVATDTLLGYRLYQFLGHRHQVVFAADGQVPLSPGRLAYLVDDLPLAARLLSHFQSTAYSAEYLDAEHRRFKGRKGDQLTTEAELILGRPAAGRAEYFGHGISKVGLWKMKGLALVQVDLAGAAGGRAVDYKVRVVSSPANAVVNAVMKLPLFRHLVRKHIREVLEDITEAARKLERQGLATSGAWTPEERRKLEAFLRLP